MLIQNEQLAARILDEATSGLPGYYVFDVVTSNFTALDRASRSDYRLVCVAEETSCAHRPSTLDGRTAACILRRVRKRSTLSMVLMGICVPSVERRL